ncbi:MAG: YgfZ/GcvT domain-containing protein [Wenzhouxiangella sp.]
MSTWYHLPHFSGLKLTGADAHAFAHAQFTTSFDHAPEPGWRLTAWCSPKGKVICVMLTRRTPDAVELVVPATQLEILATRLPMYAIGRKVELHTGLTVAGSLDAAQDPTLSLHADSGRSLVLDAACAAADSAVLVRWQTLDACAGLAWLSPGLGEQFLPQALGLEERGGLSYRKGCYPGQEVIARVHYLGKAKQRLSGFLLSGPLDCAEQDLLDGHGERIGTVLYSVPDARATLGLAVVGARFPAGLEIRCSDNDGRLCPPADLCSGEARSTEEPE